MNYGLIKGIRNTSKNIRNLPEIDLAMSCRIQMGWLGLGKLDSREMTVRSGTWWHFAGGEQFQGYRSPFYLGNGDLILGVIDERPVISTVDSMQWRLGHTGEAVRAIESKIKSRSRGFLISYQAFRADLVDRTRTKREVDGARRSKLRFGFGWNRRSYS